jgi:hypothetical protein
MKSIVNIVWNATKTNPGGQSPHDNDSTGDEIIAALNGAFQQVEFRPGFSFIYRFLGGIRGREKMVRELADLFTIFDQDCVAKGHMNPNAFFYVGRKK